MISTRAERSLAAVDSMSPEWRECVHEYGYAIVYACRVAGVVEPRRVHQLVREIWDGARSYQDKKRPGGTLDWLLQQSGSSLSAPAFARALANEHLIILPKQPTSVMIQASMDEVSGFNVSCTKFEKHQRRLRAALAAESNYLDRMTRRGT